MVCIPIGSYTPNIATGTQTRNVFESEKNPREQVEMVFPSCRIKRLYVNCYYNGISDGQFILWVMRNGSTLGSGVGFAAGETGVKYEELNVDVNEGDKICIYQYADGYVGYTWTIWLEVVLVVPKKRFIGDGLILADWIG